MAAGPLLLNHLHHSQYLHHHLNPLLLLLLVVCLFFSASYAHGGALHASLGVHFDPNGGKQISTKASIALLSERLQLPFGRVRLDHGDIYTLHCMRGTGLEVAMAVSEEIILPLSLHPSLAERWIRLHVLPFWPSTRIVLINVGHDQLLNPHLLPAMRNLHSSLSSHNLTASIKISTSLSIIPLLHPSSPPSAARFREDIANSSFLLKPLLRFLSRTGSYLSLHLHPYLAWASSPERIPLDYALLGSEHVLLHDGECGYSDLLSEQLDAAIVAIEKLGHPRIKIAIGQTGWPTGGGEGANLHNAAAYNQRLVDRLLANGGRWSTPRRADMHIPTDLYSLFDDTDQGGKLRWGIWQSDGSCRYLLYGQGRGSNGTNSHVSMGHSHGRNDAANYYSKHDVSGDGGTNGGTNNGGRHGSTHGTNDGANEAITLRREELSDKANEQLPVFPTPSSAASPEEAPSPAATMPHNNTKASPHVPAPSHVPGPAPSPHVREQPRHVQPSFPAKLPWAWCVANASKGESLVEEAMEVACAFGGADCGPVQPGRPCFQPDSLWAHASYVFNSYWQRTKHLGGTCTFDGAAILTLTDPSYEGCTFEYKD